MRQVRTFYYEGLAIDDKPTGVKPGTIVKETDTGKTWITYDDGSNWYGTDKRVRLVEEDGTFIDLPGGLEAIVTAAEAVETAVAALGYEFTINGVNFNDYSKIKMLTLDADAEDDDPQPFNFEGSPYQVGATNIFIVFQALIKLQQTDLIGRIGEADSSGGAISKEVLKLSKGTILPFMVDCWGVFNSNKFITAETNSSSDNHQLQSGSVIYGVEVDA